MNWNFFVFLWLMKRLTGVINLRFEKSPLTERPSQHFTITRESVLRNKKIYFKSNFINCARVCNPFAFCVHPPFTTAHQISFTLQKAFALRSFTNHWPGDSRTFLRFLPELSFRNLKLQEYNWFSGLYGKQTEI